MYQALSPRRARPVRAPCKIEGCDKPSRGRGWCATHWARWRTHGDPNTAHRLGVDYRIAARCSVEGCDKTAKARELCNKHYKRWRTHGDPLTVGERNGRPLSGDAPTWVTVHKRLARARGSAKGYACVDCGKPAEEWSYDRTDPAELTSTHGKARLRYSLDLARYAPRCVRCHRTFDRSTVIRLYPLGPP